MVVAVAAVASHVPVRGLGAHQHPAEHLLVAIVLGWKHHGARHAGDRIHLRPPLTRGPGPRTSVEVGCNVVLPAPALDDSPGPVPDCQLGGGIVLVVDGVLGERLAELAQVGEAHGSAEDSCVTATV